MQPPDELMARDFLPSMRQLVARELRSQGLSQGRIASALGVTQASVSMYLSSDAERAYSTLAGLSVSRENSRRYAALLAEEVQRGPEAGVRTVVSIWRALLGSGSVCGAHRAAYPSLSTCEFCITEYGKDSVARLDAIADVSDAVKLIESEPTFAAVIPEVSVNVACAPRGASSPAEVIAVPGRIVRVRGRARALLPPEAGSSMHLSNVLLVARRRAPAARACINLRYDQAMAEVLRKLGLEVIEIEGRPSEKGGDPTVAALEGRLERPTRRFDAVVDKGGGGIEPNVYLFGKGAREVARTAVEVSRAYSAR